MGKAAKLVLDAGPLLNLTREEIVAHGDQLYATPAVIREIRDEDARRRLELLKDEIKVVQPQKSSVKFATDFAKLTGDGLVLSTQDIEVIALAYELVEDKSKLRQRPNVSSGDNGVIEESNAVPEEADNGPEVDDDGFTIVKPKASKPPKNPKKSGSKKLPNQPSEDALAKSLDKLQLDNEDEDDWSDDGWISPENVSQKVQSDTSSTVTLNEDVEVAIASRDYAVQNTALQIGLCAINERGLRIKQLRNYMQRCYACFKLIPLDKQGNNTRQFCPQCGGHTLTRVSTRVDRHGTLHVYLKAKMQWITRGDRYNIPNPQSRRAKREQHDTKKEFYAEDQPEYIKAMKTQRFQQRRNERMVNEYVGPSTVETAVSPFAPNRTMTTRVQIGRGRNANETGRKTEYNLR